MFKRQRGLRLLAVMLSVVIGLACLGAVPVAAKQTSLTHKVSSGQTLWAIAQRYGVSVKELTYLNQLKDPNKLYVGQTLVVYGIESETTAAYVSTNKLNRDGLSDKEMALLARLIYAEARGEDLEGQIAVGAVVLNRLRHPEFPKNVYDVIYQPGAFTATQERQFWLQPNEKAKEAAEAAVKGIDPTHGALFYYNPVTAQDRWIKTRPVLKVIGNHTFAS